MQLNRIMPTGRVFVLDKNKDFKDFKCSYLFEKSDIYLEAKVDLFNNNLSDDSCLLIYGDNSFAMYVPKQNFVLVSMYLPIMLN